MLNEDAVGRLRAEGEVIEGEVNPVIEEIIAELRRNPASKDYLAKLAMRLMNGSELTPKERHLVNLFAEVMIFKLLNKSIQ